MDRLEKEIQATTNMMNYFGENMTNLPMALQLQVLAEYAKFSEALKPIYIVALALRGDVKEVEKDD